MTDTNTNTSNELTLQEWAATPSEHFDCTEVFEQEIKPKIDEVTELCRKHRIPFSYVAETKDTPDTVTRVGGHNLPGAARTTAVVLLCATITGLHPFTYGRAARVTAAVLDAYDEKLQLTTADEGATNEAD